MKKIILLSTLLWLQTNSYAQHGTISGRVTDENRNPIHLATVQIIKDKEGLKPTSKGAKTDKQGYYIIKDLPLGKYNLMARFPGREKEIENSVLVKLDRVSKVNFKLRVRSYLIQSGVIVIGDRPKSMGCMLFAPVTKTKLKEIKNEDTIRDADTQSIRICRADRGETLYFSCCLSSRTPIVEKKVELAKKVELNTLDQSIPNPAYNDAVIHYSLESKDGKAEILLFTQEGRYIRTYKLESKHSRGFIKMNFDELANGTYLYSLIINGKVLDTKRLQVLR